MCSKPSCLGEPWCSVWGCCEDSNMEDLQPTKKKEKRTSESVTDSDMEDFQPPKKKGKRCLSLTSNEKGKQRFVSPTSNKDMEKICKGVIPKNTQKSTDWAIGVFEEWRTNRNLATKDSAEQCPTNLLEQPTSESLNHWLARFVTETRREDGKPYPPSSINGLLAGLYRKCREYDRNCPNFMDRKDTKFRELTGALQVRFRQLRESGVGAITKHAEVITPVEEDALWEMEIIGDHNPVALQRAVFFYVGKTFCLRGGEEQRNLKVSQFVRSTDPDCYTYVENGSKNKSGTNVKEKNKIVPVYSDPASRPRCLVHLLDKYLSKLPKRGRDMDVFYLRPISKSVIPFEQRDSWYECAPVGKEKLRHFLEAMCKEAGRVTTVCVLPVQQPCLVPVFQTR